MKTRAAWLLGGGLLLAAVGCNAKLGHFDSSWECETLSVADGNVRARRCRLEQHYQGPSYEFCQRSRRMTALAARIALMERAVSVMAGVVVAWLMMTPTYVEEE